MSTRKSRADIPTRLNKREKAVLPPRRAFINLPYVDDCPHTSRSEKLLEELRIRSRREPKIDFSPTPMVRKREKPKPHAPTRRAFINLPCVYESDSAPEDDKSKPKPKKPIKPLSCLSQVPHIRGDMTSRLGVTSSESSSSVSPSKEPSEVDASEELSNLGLAESMSSLNVSSEGGACRSSQKVKPLYKNGTRTSMSFSNERMKEIERHNAILLRKIKERKRILKTQPTMKKIVKPSAAVAESRQKQKEKIELENALLDERIQAIKSITRNRRTN